MVLFDMKILKVSLETLGTQLKSLVFTVFFFYMTTLVRFTFLYNFFEQIRMGTCHLTNVVIQNTVLYDNPCLWKEIVGNLKNIGGVS